MVLLRNELILWTGEKQSGKTTCAANLTRMIRMKGFKVAGVLAPSIYLNGKLKGFDVLDLQNNIRVPLLRLQEKAEKRHFQFIEDGLKLGNAALTQAATEHVDLIIIDEFGPLELGGRVWRKNVDSLLTCNNNIILLVVRHGLVEVVRQLYKDIPCYELNALDPESIDKVANILKDRN